MVEIPNRKSTLIIQTITGITVVALVALGCWLLQSIIDYKTASLLLLLSVLILAMLFDIWPVLIAAVLSALSWNFFFIPPVFTFHINASSDALMFVMYFVVALVNAVLTQKLRKERQRVRLRKEQAKTIALYQTLFNSLSHELKTPIATIIGSTDALIENRAKLSLSNQEQLLQQINDAGLRLNRQVENLLHMSRLESGLLKPNYTWCDVQEFIHQCIKKLDKHEHTIQFNPTNNLPLIQTDITFLEQIVVNLLHNAIQYTPTQTNIWIEVCCNDNQCELRVCDNGPGIAPEFTASLFDKFYRVPNTKAGGTGLGLSIVKGFAKALNGHVHYENIAPQGSVFVLKFPTELSYVNQLKHE